MRQRLWLAVLIIAALVASSLISYCSGKRSGQAEVRIARNDSLIAEAARDRHRAIDSALAAHQQVERAQPVVTAAHDAARLVGPTTVEIRVTPSAAPQLVELPAQVITRMVEDSLQLARQARENAKLWLVVAADSTQIKWQAIQITELKALKTPKCQAKCGAAIALGGLLVTGLVVKNADQILATITNLFR